MFNYFASPKRLNRLFNFLLRGLLPTAVVVTLFGVWLALFNSPSDYQQADAVRIMYVHVPAAWLSLGIYFAMSLLNMSGLVWRHITAFLLAKSAALVGAAFTLICLVTGSIWGKPMWGTWWVWDARLTSVFILFLLYIGYMVIVSFNDSISDNSNDERTLKVGALLNVFGAINLPIIKWSVNWWNTLHQPASITKLASPSIHPEMLKPLLVMFVGFSLISLYLIIVRYKSITMQRKSRLRELMQQIKTNQQQRKTAVTLKNKNEKDAA